MAEPRDKGEDETAQRITGEQLREWRKSVGMTQHQLAKHIGYGHTAVSHWERGEWRIPNHRDFYQHLMAGLERHGREEGERLNKAMYILTHIRDALLR